MAYLKLFVLSVSIMCLNLRIISANLSPAFQFADQGDEVVIPQSPDIRNSEEVTTVEVTEETTTLADNIENETQDETVHLKSEDLSQQYLPEYCRCVASQFCVAKKRVERAVNTPSCAQGQVMCCLTDGPGCGVVDPFPYFNPYPSYGEANFAEYPWTALVMDTSNQYIYGLGIIISGNTVITSARNIENIRGRPFKVRLGEWDLASNNEPFPPQEYLVSDFRVHPEYNQKTFQNDIAFLRLNTSFNLGAYPHIRSACLVRPEQARRFAGARCIFAGWGIKPSSRIVPGRNLLKEVDLQIHDAPVCQQAIRRAIKNPEYYWDSRSFICAGGLVGKGLCKGDEGGALICQDTPTSRYTVVGVASWGTSCGEGGFPSVFTNLANYYDWIKSVDPNIGQL